MDHGKYSDRQIRPVCDQVGADNHEADILPGYVRSPKALRRRGSECPYPVEQRFDEAIGRVGTVLGNVAADLFQVGECRRMKDVTAQAVRLRRCASVLSMRSRKASSPS